MKRNFLFSFTLLISCSLPEVFAENLDIAIIADEFIYCSVCHGTNYKGNVQTQAPRLSGLSAWYIERQLRSFRQGLRGYHENDLSGQQMRTMAQPLTDRQISTVAKAVSDASVLGSSATVEGDVNQGETLFAACSVCHGEKAEGNQQLGAPALYALDDWYIKAQLLKFRAGERGTHPEDKWGALMLAPAQALADNEAVDNVTAYIAQVQSPQNPVKESSTMNKAFVASTLLAVSAASTAAVTRYPLPNNSTFPIARAVEVTPDTTLIYHSGQVPGPLNPDAKRGSAEYYGDTEAQALNIFKKFEDSFKDLGVGFGDVVKMTVFLVGDPAKNGEMDFAGFMKAYTQYFGTKEQPNLPARSAVQIAGLAGGPNMLVEIEMVIAKPKGKSKEMKSK